MITKALLAATAVLSLGTLLLFSADAPDAADILKKVDHYRNPLNSFAVDVELTSYRKNESESWSFRVYGKDGDKSLVEFLSPAVEKGKYLLMLREAMWIYIPNTSRPIRISPLQRLMGDASNGDVARSNYSIDYEAQIVGEEQAEGHDAHVLDLKARDTEVSYSRVKLWVAKSNYLPIKAEYYVNSGKLMKLVYFRELSTVHGSRMVTGIEIHDVVRPDRRTLMRYTNLALKQLPDKTFNKSYLGKW